MRRLTQVFGHGAAARADFQHVILRAHAAQAHQFLQQRLVIDKVLAQALLIAQLAVPNALLCFAHNGASFFSLSPVV